VTPTGLHALRVLAGLVFIAWLLPLGGQLDAFYGMQGWFDREAYLERDRLANEITASQAENPMTPENVPDLPLWSLLYGFGSSKTLLHAFYWGGIAVFALFTLGVGVRITGLLTWVVVVSFLASPAVNYEGDDLLVIPAFYLMIGYLLLGQWSRDLSAPERILGPRNTSLFAWLLGKRRDAEPESIAANLALRLFQVHFAIVVVISGLHKLQFGRWWGGVALWFPLHPPFETTADELRFGRNPTYANVYHFTITVAQYLMLAWQIGFPLFAWKRRWRAVLLGGAIVGWIGSAFIYKLPLFGPVYFLGCLSFLSASEWSWIAEKLSRVWERLARGVPVPDRKVKVPT
jgi:hypothetical protein